jgi:hypothetical protein
MEFVPRDLVAYVGLVGSTLKKARKKHPARYLLSISQGELLIYGCGISLFLLNQLTNSLLNSFLP